MTIRSRGRDARVPLRAMRTGRTTPLQADARFSAEIGAIADGAEAPHRTHVTGRTRLEQLARPAAVLVETNADGIDRAIILL